MKCGYCKDLDHPVCPTDRASIHLENTSNGRPSLVATYPYERDMLIIFGPVINYCPKCGRKFRGDTDDKR